MFSGGCIVQLCKIAGSTYMIEDTSVGGEGCSNMVDI